MSDAREKQPKVRVFDSMIAANYVVEIKAFVHNGLKNEDVMSRKLVYHICADSFGEAFRFAEVLRDTVRAMHDIWVSEIVRIEEKS